MLQEKLDLFTANDWLSKYKKVVEIEEYNFECDNFIDNILEELIINFTRDSSEDNSDFGDSDGEKVN